MGETGYPDNLKNRVTLLQEEVRRRIRAEDRIRHLNAVLRAVRNVNRLIMKEKDIKRLIHGACENLVGTRGYYNAWIALFNTHETLQASAEAGLNKAFSSIITTFQSRKDIHCFRHVKKTGDLIVIDDPLSFCTGCPVSHLYHGRGALVKRLEYGGNIYGMLTVSIPGEYCKDLEEHRLFTDVAGEIAFGLYSIEVENRRKRSEDALLKARDELEKRVKDRTRDLEMLSAMLLNIQEDERKRIAADLHDGIGQSLSAIKFSVETILEQAGEDSGNPHIQSLHQLLPMLKQASEEVRTIVMNLRPSILDDLGIIATIHWFCRQFKEIYNDMEIEKTIEIQEKQIPHHLKTIIYRVLQEAMNNIAKHSNADRVELSLLQKDNQVRLIVKDNGSGFDTRLQASKRVSEKGFGITGMKERTELFRGTFDIQSDPSTGTRICASWDIYS